MLSVIDGNRFSLLSLASGWGKGLSSADLQILSSLFAAVVGLNLYLAFKYWPTYYAFMRIAVPTIGCVALLGASFALAGFFGVIIWVGLLIVALTLFVQFPRARRRATLDLLTLAVEKRMPLPPVIKALAADQRGNGRLLDLALNLERGMLLSAALKAEPHLLPRDAIVAAQMGEATGNLAAALRQAEASDALGSPIRQALLGHVLYLVGLVLILLVVVGFVVIFIIPKYIMLFDDYGLELPPLTVSVIQFIYRFYWLGLCLPILGGGVLVYVISCYAEFCRLPSLGWGFRFERGRVLRALALGTAARRPLGETLAALAKNYPDPETARHLESCAYETQSGANWVIGLLKHRLIGVHDAALIDAAQRLDNLPWALREAADGNDRRLIYRLEAALNVVSPIVLLALGAMIFFFVVACFLPLVTLILALSN